MTHCLFNFICGCTKDCGTNTPLARIVAAMEPTDRDASSSTPKPPRFTGSAPMQARALAVWRYIQIIKAINAFEDGVDIQRRVIGRVRWSVGIHREMVCVVLSLLRHRYH